MAETDRREDAPELIDLRHRGHPRVIGAWRIGDVLIDPGPASTLPRLLEAIADRPPRALALTHIHLDHAGASGSLVRRFPDLEVWVHERGAPHLADPSRLLQSAARIYGEEMGPLWGEVLPVPSERLRVLRGGERLAGMRVAHTPGHAVHHVAYLHEDIGWAFAGDVAGVRIGAGPLIAPTPPPDIDLRAWRESLRTIERWRPQVLAVAHFGSHEDVGAHLQALREHLAELETTAGQLDEERFAIELRRRIAAAADAETVGAYERASSPEQNHRGLVRYLRTARSSGFGGGPSSGSRSATESSTREGT